MIKPVVIIFFVMALSIGSLGFHQNMFPYELHIQQKQYAARTIENVPPTIPEEVNISLLDRLHLIPKIIPNATTRGETQKNLTVYNFIIIDTDDRSITTLQTLPPVQFNFSVNNSVYSGAISKKYNAIFSSNLNREQNYYLSYNAFIDDSEQDELYNNILNELRKYRYQNFLDDDEYLELIVRFVQSIPNKERQYSRFPVETVFEGNGVCEDKSFLLAGLLEREDYDVGLFTFENKNSSLPGHMVVGVKSNGLHYNGTQYTLVETTMTDFPGATREYHYIGWTNNFSQSYKSPIFTRIGDGKKEYTKSNQIAYIKKSIDECIDHANTEGLTGKMQPSTQNTTEVCQLIQLGSPYRESAVIWLNHHVTQLQNTEYVAYGESSQSKIFYKIL